MNILAVNNLVARFRDAVVNDEEINGGDAVEAIGDFIRAAIDHEAEQSDSLHTALCKAALDHDSLHEGTLEVDDNAVVSLSEEPGVTGAYVAAWLWVSAEEAGICRKCEAVNADNGEGWDGLCGTCADKEEAK